MKKGKLKQSKGITLISLVITIIVLLILAAVSIGMLFGENGILTRANEAAEATSYATAEEKVKLAILGSYDNTGKMSDKLIVEELYKFENQGMTSLTDKDGIDIAKGTLDLTDKYPIKTVVDGYEFEIEKTGKVTGNETSTGNTGGTTNPPEEDTLGSGNWNGDVNSPKLGDEMTPVAWDDSNNEFTPTTNQEWYDYKDTSETGADTSKWANAKTSDGSYWVWIPRYEYKITYTNSSDRSQGGNIDINFIPVTQTSSTSGYRIHPAFEDGSDTNFTNGEWDKELAGIWVMKYEASNSSNTPKSIPGVTSWRNITIGNMYTYSLNYDTTKGSHLIKNSEWGAVAYLAHSEYGRNGVEVTINNNGTTYYTGGGVENAYKINVNQSTTGNVTGIYDLNGNAFEYVAGYIPNENSNLLTYGSPMITSSTGVGSTSGYRTYSTKYVTAYPYSSSDSFETNYNQYAAANSSIYGYGDSILETSTVGSGSMSWNSDSSYFPASTSPFFGRGGGYAAGSNGGIFYFSRNKGTAGANDSFRTVLTF